MRKLRLYRCPVCYTGQAKWQGEVKTFPACLQCGTGLVEVLEYRAGSVMIRQQAATA